MSICTQAAVPAQVCKKGGENKMKTEILGHLIGIVNTILLAALTVKIVILG